MKLLSCKHCGTVYVEGTERCEHENCRKKVDKGLVPVELDGPCLVCAGMGMLSDGRFCSRCKSDEAKQFSDHLDKAAEEVKKWPERKRNVHGTMPTDGSGPWHPGEGWD